MAALTSVELNYLVFRYLHESGFNHSAFVLGYEAGINKTTVDGNLVPPGALVTFVQKGMQYLELEANTANGDADGDDDFSFIKPLDLITKDVNELRKIVKEKKENLQKEREKEKEKDREKERERDREHERERIREREKQEKEKEKERIEKEKEREIYKEKEKEKAKEKEKEKQQEEQHERPFIRDREEKLKVKEEEHGGSGGPEPMDVCNDSPALGSQIPSSDVTVLEGHSSEVFACAWSPTCSLLASGSGDSTARIWMIPDGPRNIQSGPPRSLVLKHLRGRSSEKCKDVTTLDWNAEGMLLATGSYDGNARIWNRDGELMSTLIKHKGPIFSLKWNKKGDYLLSGSVDKTAIVWDVKTGEWKQQFEFHAAPALDVDWRNNNSFATCSTDAMIYVCKIGDSQPMKTFADHQAEVNAIKWDPTGSLLASCSDDVTAKIWSLNHDKCLHDLKEHTKEIYTIKWSPTGPGTNNPNLPLILASASFDSTVKLWDVELGSLLLSFSGHSEPVYSVAFSPNAEYIATGSLDKSVIIWSRKDGKIIKTYQGNGGAFEVCWNKEGDKVAACFSDSNLCVLDVRM